MRATLYYGRDRNPAMLFLIVLIGSLLFGEHPALAQKDDIRQVVVANTSVPKELKYPSLVRQFYAATNHQLFWMKTGDETKNKRAAFQLLLDNCNLSGLNVKAYNRSIKLSAYDFSNITGLTRQELLMADMIITDAALSFCKDLYQGAAIKKWVSYDELSLKCATADDEYIISVLQLVRTDEDLLELAAKLEPQDRAYITLKKALETELGNGNANKVKQLISSMNYYRWIHHFQLNEFVVVNIGSATVKYFNGDTMQLKMKALVGTVDTRTPRFATYCTKVVLYPYWNVPRSIALNNFLPRFKRSPALLELLNIQVLDSKGKIIDPKTIKWASLNRKNFPYRFREMTGCVNPLGVVKFDITDPYSVYLHDTNFKGAFLSKNRYYSHGCIRVEEPVALAIALLKQQVDTGFLQACYEDMKPVTIKLPVPVPVFVVYMTAEVDSEGVVQYFKDRYKLL